MIGSFAIFKTKRVIIKATHFDTAILADYGYSVKCNKEVMEITPITFKDSDFIRDHLPDFIQEKVPPLIELFFGKKCSRLGKCLKERKRYLGFNVGLTGVTLLVVSFED